ncbi:sugar phosphate isomerase/epimerase family protein [Pantoea anthophila]|uniref:sugar phosphate isomerase/epimerase family protein n=1 Tax=Pantoea anthophila TaxID=470931 RepID=UPI003CF1ACCD
MNISISNIAWDVKDDDAVCSLLQRHQIRAIDIAPGKYFPEPKSASDKEILAVRSYWESQGISLVGMQSLLFGTQGLNLFDERSVQQKMLEHLQAVSHVAAGLGITRLVFGSPKNRYRPDIVDEESRAIAHHFFTLLGNIARQEGVVICLEPNPECYGANFMTSSAETAEMVRFIDHSAIKMQLDTGAIAINQEDVTQVISGNVDIIGHVHLSEPNLIPLGRSEVNHAEVAEVLNRLLPQSIATIEMLVPKEENALTAIDASLSFVTEHYRHSLGDVS